MLYPSESAVWLACLNCRLCGECVINFKDFSGHSKVAMTVRITVHRSPLVNKSAKQSDTVGAGNPWTALCLWIALYVRGWSQPQVSNHVHWRPACDQNVPDSSPPYARTEKKCQFFHTASVEALLRRDATNRMACFGGDTTSNIASRIKPFRRVHCDM